MLGEYNPDFVQRGLFSATVGPLVQDLNAFLRNPVRIMVGVENAGATTQSNRSQHCNK